MIVNDKKTIVNNKFIKNFPLKPKTKENDKFCDLWN